MATKDVPQPPIPTTPTTRSAPAPPSSPPVQAQSNAAGKQFIGSRR